eukprot:scaffold2281_cov215-Alexandrium_tamarense.AAC.14
MGNFFRIDSLAARCTSCSKKALASLKEPSDSLCSYRSKSYRWSNVIQLVINAVADENIVK